MPSLLCDHSDHITKIHYFRKKSLSLPKIKKTMYIVDVFVLRRSHIGHIVKNIYYLKIFSTPLDGTNKNCIDLMNNEQ